MNNLQHIIANDTRAAMHMAVELCEQGNFDSVADAFGWLLQERDDAAPGCGECELVYGENDHGDDGWWCQSCGGWFAASFRHTGRDNIIEPNYCQQCGGKAVKR